CWWQPVAGVDAAGRFEHAPSLGAQNESTYWNGRADAPGYWYQQKGAVVAEGEPATVEYELVEQCLARLVGGTVRYRGSNATVAGAGVGVHLSGGTRPDLTVQTREDGTFDVDREVLLGHDNAATEYRVTVTPPADAPPGTQGSTSAFRVAACDAQVSETFYLHTPQPNYGAVEGVVTDEETGEPLADVWVDVGTTGARTDVEGRYRLERFHVGNDGQTQANATVATEPAGYYRAAVNRLIVAGQTAQADLKVLRKRFAALDVSVVDSVTGAPIPGARVSNGSCSGFSLCIVTGREGTATRGQIALGNRNAPVGYSLSATAEGYWPQAKPVTLRADETASLEYELQPECEPARVTGRVVNAETQEPIHQARVQGGGAWPVFTGTDGRFVIEGIKPSTGNNPRQVTISASASGFYSQSKQITIFCGANIVVDFGSRNAKTGTVVGTVTDAVTGEPLAGAFVGSDFGGTTTTGEDGAYRLEQVPLGDLDADRQWSVVVQPAGYKARTKPVVVTAGAETRLDFAFSPANAPPVGQPRAVEVDEDQWVEFQLAGSDPDGDALTYHVMRWPEHGDLSGQRGRFVYEPDSDYHGRDSLEFIVNDGVASSERVTVELTVRPVNDVPSALADEFEGQPDTEQRIPIATLLANDRDRDDDALQVVEVRANHPQATVRIEGDEVVFMPPPGWASDILRAFFDYTIEDAAGARSTAWVYIRVNHTPTAPACADAAFAVLRDQTLAETVDCTDVNGDAITYAVAEPPAQGTLALAENGSFTYAPPAGFTGEVAFTYTASDGALESAPATVTIDVRADNATPECADVEAATGEDEAVELALTCADADGDALAIEPRSEPEHGTLTPVAPGRYRYTPDPDRSGPDAFTFGAGDGMVESAPATATIAVRPVNDAPAAGDGTVELAEDDEDVAVDLAALATDVETADGDLAFEIVDGPAKGRLDGTGAERTYTPARDVHGTDSLTYRVRDRGDPDGCAPTGEDCDEPLADEGTVTFTIAPVNDLPACEGLALEAVAGQAASIAPVCADADGDALTFAIAAQSAKGSAAVNGGKLRYVPRPDAGGEDGFSYRAADGTGASDPAAVTVTIRPRPVARDDELATDEDVAVTAPVGALAANDSAPGGGPVSVTAVGAAEHGSVALAAGEVTFAPAPDFHGTAGFTYTVEDGHGATATARVAVTVRPVNDAPVALADELSTGHGQELTVAAATLLANDRDVDGDALHVESASDAEHGSVVLDGASVRFAPAPGFAGAARFRYVAADGMGGRHGASVTVHVAAPQAAPPVTPAAEPPSGGDLLLGCTRRAVVLEDVVRQGRRVKLLGVADRRLAGRRAAIRFLATGKVVARPVVRPDGRFAATVKAPPPRLRSSGRARYQARIGDERSLALKLERRMQVSRVRAAGGRVTIRGRVTRPLAPRRRDRAIDVQLRRSCSKAEVVARVMPDRRGRFKVTLDAPQGEQAAVYRLRTKVRRTAASRKLFRTFTLPRAVDF
ncbi:MAG TPA: Ig-like domain-containing protein, partial [Solirubrobacter sp.]|nr:Ig-like domain-containing protein [Solirubrobacter sp.]